MIRLAIPRLESTHRGIFHPPREADLDDGRQQPMPSGGGRVRLKFAARLTGYPVTTPTAEHGRRPEAE